MNNREQQVADKVLKRALKARFARGARKWLAAYNSVVSSSGTRQFQDKESEKDAK